MTDKQIDRKSLTFEQAEGRDPLPSQSALKTLSSEARALLWYFVHSTIHQDDDYDLDVGGYPIADPWRTMMLRDWILRKHNAVDEYDHRIGTQQQIIKNYVMFGDYIQSLGFLQFVLRDPTRPEQLPSLVATALEKSRSAYRVVDQDTIAPVSDENEIAALERAFADVRKVAFGGARAHLRSASEAATAGRWAESITQSIHAVEATAKSLVPGSKQLKPALDALSAQGQIHGALMTGFLRIYDFTSDEKGLRHSLSDVAAAKVDETDALFMLGACAAFVSYLINKGRAAGLLQGKGS